MKNTDDELKPADLLPHEDDILKGLFAAADRFANAYKTIDVTDPDDNNTVLYSFRIRALRADEMEACSEKATRYERNVRTGVMQVANFDSARFNSLVIYTATHPEDRAQTWDNKALWARLNVLTGPEVIDALMPVGIKGQVIRQIEHLSGYDADLQATAKN